MALPRMSFEGKRLFGDNVFRANGLLWVMSLSQNGLENNNNITSNANMTLGRQTSNGRV